ncbi:type I restriction-modification system subunit M N-terminal domain-containing protein [Aneurinibacillus aneurinilyticus]|nr:type I restriction-modification system subunit M N-terminal domain-containing protein [Aneurinibacillus aneurinilyticus]MED0709757.1 type I restriction-modification system subunit M N-terminal domain-containing protein [Aneurinibacillus aneurinilyticus]MED0726492.1 type I restriction-modification system subunit M N-terminal domain-containing protein [Aneurinibacillus aneurinilyticus]MED0735360.1 type I restriction-modification system subunit M N-terminal domain-containing protein [Aneurinibac
MSLIFGNQSISYGGGVDSSDYKNYIFVLLFLKRLSDV